MHLPFGSVINASLVLSFAILGTFIGKYVSKRVKNMVFTAISVSIMIYGSKLAFESSFLAVVSSLILGGLIGTICHIDFNIKRFGNFLKKTVKSKDNHFTYGFVTATMIFCTGTIGVIGPIEESLTGKIDILLIKITLDTFTSFILASTFGVGVGMSFIPLFLYQCSIFFLAPFIAPYLTEIVRLQLSAIGGVSMFCVGLNMLKLKKIPVANFIPAIIIVIIISNLFLV